MARQQEPWIKHGWRSIRKAFGEFLANKLLILSLSVVGLVGIGRLHRQHWVVMSGTLVENGQVTQVEPGQVLLRGSSLNIIRGLLTGKHLFYVTGLRGGSISITVDVGAEGQVVLPGTLTCEDHEGALSSVAYLHRLPINRIQLIALDSSGQNGWNLLFETKVAFGKDFHEINDLSPPKAWVDDASDAELLASETFTGERFILKLSDVEYRICSKPANQMTFKGELYCRERMIGRTVLRKLTGNRMVLIAFALDGRLLFDLELRPLGQRFGWYPSEDLAPTSVNPTRNNI